MPEAEAFLPLYEKCEKYLIADLPDDRGELFAYNGKKLDNTKALDRAHRCSADEEAGSIYGMRVPRKCEEGEEHE